MTASMIRLMTKLSVKTTADQRCHADQLRDQLARIAVEQAGDDTVHAVPGAAVVALAVGEQTDGDHAPQAVGAVHRNGADRIVDLHHLLDELDREADQSTPAIKPMMTAPTGLTKPLGAVIATRPASSPLPVMEASGLP